MSVNLKGTVPRDFYFRLFHVSFPPRALHSNTGGHTFPEINIVGGDSGGKFATSVKRI